MFGLNTCEFIVHTGEEPCNRSIVLSAFFHFYRKHSILSAIPQESYGWASVAEASKKTVSRMQAH